MKRTSIILLLICLVCTLSFANDVTIESELEQVVQEARNETSKIKIKESTSSEIDARYQEITKKHKRSDNPEQKVINNFALIIASTPLITFGGWFCGFTGFLFATTRENHPLHNPVAVWGATPCIVAGMGLISAGLAMLLVGAVHLPRSFKESNTEELTRRLKKLDRNLENLIIVSGVFSGIGLSSLGTGIGLMCYSNAIHYKINQAEIQYATGVALTVVGTIFTFAFVPLFASSLSIFCINKKKLISLSPEVAITHNDKKDINEGYELSLGLKIRI